MKYSKEFKIECVKKYKANEYIKDPPRTKHRSFHVLVMRW